MTPTPPELYREAAALGLTLDACGEFLRVAPAEQVPPAFKEKLKAHKAELMAWLNTPPCPGWQTVPPANLPLGTIPPRPTPANRERLIGYFRRQTADRPCALSAWLVQRENAYFDGPGTRWDCALLSYAAARDAAKRVDSQ